MLIHTSGKKADMTVDHRHVDDVFSVLKNAGDKDYEPYVRQI